MSVFLWYVISFSIPSQFKILIYGSQQKQITTAKIQQGFIFTVSDLKAPRKEKSHGRHLDRKCSALEYTVCVVKY